MDSDNENVYKLLESLTTIVHILETILVQLKSMQKDMHVRKHEDGAIFVYDLAPRRY